MLKSGKSFDVRRNLLFLDHDEKPKWLFDNNDQVIITYRVHFLWVRPCQRLLRESGFEQVVVTGKSSDGGIDGHGILKVNPLVSFNVIFQCKRYKDSVSSSQIRDFRGAMSGRADKGIFLTTGRFTQEAKKEARRDGAHPIELVDGEMLVNMFEQLELGMKQVAKYEIDHRFFAEYMN